MCCHGNIISVAAGMKSLKFFQHIEICSEKLAFTFKTMKEKQPDIKYRFCPCVSFFFCFFFNAALICFDKYLRFNLTIIFPRWCLTASTKRPPFEQLTFQFEQVVTRAPLTGSRLPFTLNERLYCLHGAHSLLREDSKYMELADILVRGRDFMLNFFFPSNTLEAASLLLLLLLLIHIFIYVWVFFFFSRSCQKNSPRVHIPPGKHHQFQSCQIKLNCPDNSAKCSYICVRTCLCVLL